jgi:hypothetical protein
MAWWICKECDAPLEAETRPGRCPRCGAEPRVRRRSPTRIVTARTLLVVHGLVALGLLGWVIASAGLELARGHSLTNQYVPWSWILGAAGIFALGAGLAILAVVKVGRSLAGTFFTAVVFAAAAGLFVPYTLETDCPGVSIDEPFSLCGAFEAAIAAEAGLALAALWFARPDPAPTPGRSRPSPGSTRPAAPPPSVRGPSGSP